MSDFLHIRDFFVQLFESTHAGKTYYTHFHEITEDDRCFWVFEHCCMVPSRVKVSSEQFDEELGEVGSVGLIDESVVENSHVFVGPQSLHLSYVSYADRFHLQYLRFHVSLQKMMCQSTKNILLGRVWKDHAD